MTRSALLAVFAVAAFGVSPATAQQPGVVIVTATADTDTVTWTETVTVPVARKVTVTVEIDGKAVQQERDVTTFETKQLTRAASLKDVKATDATGKAVPADKLAERLKKPAAVVILTAPLLPEHRALFKDSTLFLDLTPTPKDPNKGKK